MSHNASSNDHDPTIGISDGKSFIGAHAADRNTVLCHILEGDSSTTILKNINFIDGPTVISKFYTSEIKIQIRPAEKWGSCHTEHDGGYTHVSNYHHFLDPRLDLEIYYDHANEKYRIKYIVVDVDLD